MRDKIEKYINENYSDVLQEYPWDDDPKSTTFKHRDNMKWFALIMEIPYRRINIDKDENVDVINLKNIPELIGGLRKQKGILPAYHMNKEHWISVLLDGTVPICDIFKLIDVSYTLTMKKSNKIRSKEN